MTDPSRIDPKRILDQLMKDGFGGGMAGGLIGGALSGALVGGKGGKLAKLGSLAAVGALAYKTYAAYQQTHAPGRAGMPAATPGTAPGLGAFAAAAGGAAATPPPQITAGEGLLMLRAMIAAAKADGQIDAAESQRIHEHVARSALTAEEKGFLFEELGRPLDLDGVVSGVRTPEQAAEVYAASRLVVAEASPAEQAYLALLAARLGLEPGVRDELDRAVQALPRA